MGNNFYGSLRDESTALPTVKCVLRDSLGYLAVQMLVRREDFDSMSDCDKLTQLESIIDHLHEVYDANHFG